MYCYIYDDFLAERKHERELSNIEGRITDLGLQGKIVRLALFRRADEMIRDEVANGVKTVVVVGNDATVNKVANAVVDTGAVLALIPVGEPSVLARILGVPRGVAACDTLSQRIIERIDVGRINDSRFITGVFIPNSRAVVRAGSKFDMMTMRKGEIEVRNLSVQVPKTPQDVSNPVDGKMDIVITTQVARKFRKAPAVSSVPLSSCEIILDDPVTALVDGVEMEGDKFVISTEKGALKAVVGRDRMF